MFLFGNLSAQAPYTLHISGQLEGCTPGQQVTVQTLPGTLPAQMATAAVATDCSFSATFGMDSPSGGVLAFFHCGNGTVTADSSAYAISGPSGSTDIMLQLTCGSDTSSACQAGTLRLNQPKHGMRRNSGIHSAAALLHDVERCINRALVGC